jgi:hypothetical protein
VPGRAHQVAATPGQRRVVEVHSVDIDRLDGRYRYE